MISSYYEPHSNQMVSKMSYRHNYSEKLTVIGRILSFCFGQNSAKIATGLTPSGVLCANSAPIPTVEASVVSINI